MLDDEGAFEDGTVNFLSIPDVTTGLDWIDGIGIDLIRRRVSMLTGWLVDRLGRLRHDNGAPLIRLYGPAAFCRTRSRGVTTNTPSLSTPNAVIVYPVYRRRIARMRLGVLADIHGSEIALRAVLDDAAGCGADIVIGGHTHRAADRVIGRIRVLNPGSTGIPERPGQAGWLLLAAPGEHIDDPAAGAAVRVEHRTVPFDVDAVVRDLRARLHPNAEFLESILTGKRSQRKR